MSLNSVMTNIRNTNWAKINNFEVDITFLNSKLLKAFGIPASELPDILKTCLVSVDTTGFTNQPIEEFIGYKWTFNNTRDELYRFSMTFRDFDDMVLYKAFVKMYRRTKGLYPAESKINIKVSTGIEYENDKVTQLIEYEDAMIESVSQLQFNNTTENQIAEFSVSFKCSKLGRFAGEDGTVQKYTY